MAPPAGLLLTGANMSGKSTLLRTVGITVVLAQTINTCLASSCDAPVLRVRSLMGRADDLIAGKSYYLVEAEADRRDAAPPPAVRRTCSCSTSCSAAPTRSSASPPVRRS